MVLRRKAGRPSTNPVLSHDFFGRHMRKGDFVNYAIPGNKNGGGKMALGQIIGKNAGYLSIVCLLDKFFEVEHNKRGSELVKVSGDLIKFLEPYIELPSETKAEVESYATEEEQGLQA